MKPSVILARVPSAYLITPPGHSSKVILYAKRVHILLRGEGLWYGTVDADSDMSEFRLHDLFILKCLHLPDSTV